MTIASIAEKYQAAKKRLTYKDLLGEIVAHNTEKASRAMGRISEARYKAAGKKALKTGLLELPAWETVMPPRAYFLRKGQDSGEIISDTLRRRLSTAMREEMSLMQEGSRLSPDIISRFEQRVRETMGSYTRGEKGARPPNAKLIATMECRTAFNEAKFEYAKKLSLVNTDKVSIWKRWKHNAHLVAQGRPGHIALNNKRVGLYESFSVEGFKKVEGDWVRTGTIQMMHPHDPMASLEETAGCQCDYDMEVEVLPGAVDAELKRG